MKILAVASAALVLVAISGCSSDSHAEQASATATASIAVPDVSKMTGDKARDALTKAGLVAELDGGAD